MKASLGLMVYRKAGMKFRRRYRILPKVPVFVDISLEEWILKHPNLRDLNGKLLNDLP